MKLRSPSLCLIAVASIAAASAADLNYSRIDVLTGIKGKLNEKEAVYKISVPRADVSVIVDGWKMPPFMRRETWAAFTKGAHSEAMVMGEFDVRWSACMLCGCVGLFAVSGSEV
jgi:hypothetical protein